MAAFTVWKFEDPAGAQHAAEKLRDSEREQLIKILDYAVVTWPVTGNPSDATELAVAAGHTPVTWS